MLNPRHITDFRLVNGDGIERSFQEYLADFNILAIRRVPIPSHGPATKLLERLLAKHRGDEDVTVCGFDIRSPDRPCESCRRPHIVFKGSGLATICDGDGSILRKFGVEGYDRFFVVRSGPQVIDGGSIEEIARPNVVRRPDGDAPQERATRAPPNQNVAGTPANGIRRKFPSAPCIQKNGLTPQRLPQRRT